MASVVAKREQEIAGRSVAMEALTGSAQTKAIIVLHYDFVWRSLRRFGVPSADADDAAQRVFLVYARRAESVEPGKEKAFLFGVVLRVAQTKRRDLGKAAEVSDEEAIARFPSMSLDPEALLDEARARAVLDTLLEAMPIELRTVFVLHEIEEITMAEISGVLEVPSGTVASRLRRARHLFEQLSERVRVEKRVP